MKPKEYQISDPEVLKQGIFDLVTEGVEDQISRFESAGLSCSATLAEEGVLFAVQYKGKSFEFCVTFISDGQNGGYIVSPMLKRGTAVPAVAELLDKIFVKIRDEGFDEAASAYGGLMRDYSKEKDRLVWLMPALFTVAVLFVAVAVAVTVYVLTQV